MLETILALLLFLFPLAYSPGPGNMFFAANGARFGFRATLWANFGYHIATFIVALAIGLGFAVAMAQFAQMFVALKVVGAVYVLWLAWKMLRSDTLKGAETAQVAGFIDGVILLLLNPKAYVIIALMFTQFLNGTDGTGAVLLITGIFTLNNLVAFTLWSALGDVISQRFRGDTSARRLNLLFSIILASVAIWMLVL